jgi:hypothetical protein
VVTINRGVGRIRDGIVDKLTTVHTRYILEMDLATSNKEMVSIYSKHVGTTLCLYRRGSYNLLLLLLHDGKKFVFTGICEARATSS